MKIDKHTLTVSSYSFVAAIFGAAFAIILLVNISYDKLFAQSEDYLKLNNYNEINNHMALIGWAEKGETEKIIKSQCWLLKGQLKWFQPEGILDETEREKMVELREEARKLIETLDSEGKCITNR
jgi:hypothetical protein